MPAVPGLGAVRPAAVKIVPDGAGDDEREVGVFWVERGGLD